MVPLERTREELGSDNYRGGMVVEAPGVYYRVRNRFDRLAA
jgi:hypothetical protein